MLLILVVLCLGIVGGILAPMLSSGGQASRDPDITRVPSRTPGSSQAPIPDVTSAPHKVDAKLTTRLLFAHQAIGKDIVRGIPLVYNSADIPAPKMLAWDRAKKTKGPLVATAIVGRNGDALGKLRAFARLVNDAPRRNIHVALLALDSQDVNAETDIDDLFQSYTDTMNSLEAASPDISFLYATVPLTTANSWLEIERSKITGLSNVNQPVWQDNIARERLNTLVRDRYSETGRLFDIAALQADTGGNKVAAKQHEDLWYYVMNPAQSSDGKRLNGSGSQHLAQSLILLVNAASRA